MSTGSGMSSDDPFLPSTNLFLEFYDDNVLGWSVSQTVCHFPVSNTLFALGCTQSVVTPALFAKQSPPSPLTDEGLSLLWSLILLFLFQILKTWESSGKRFFLSCIGWHRCQDLSRVVLDLSRLCELELQIHCLIVVLSKGSTNEVDCMGNSQGSWSVTWQRHDLMQVIGIVPMIALGCLLHEWCRLGIKACFCFSAYQTVAKCKVDYGVVWPQCHHNQNATTLLCWCIRIRLLNNVGFETRRHVPGST